VSVLSVVGVHLLFAISYRPGRAPALALLGVAGRPQARCRRGSPAAVRRAPCGCRGASVRAARAY